MFGFPFSKQKDVSLAQAPPSFRKTRRAFIRFTVIGFLLAVGLALSLAYLSIEGVSHAAPGLVFDGLNQTRAISIYVGMSILVGLTAAFIMIFALGRHMVLTPLVELRRSQMRLRESESYARRLALVAEKASDLVIIYDATGHIIWVNRAFVKTTGFQPGEVIGRKPGELLSRGSLDPVAKQRIEDAMKKGEPVNAQIINHSKTGREYLVEASISPVRDADGELTNFIAVERDITERHMAERRLREAIEIMEDGFTVFDADDRLLMFNGAYERIMGVEGDLYEGMPLVEIGAALLRNGVIALNGETLEEWAAKRSAQMRREDVATLRPNVNGKALLCRSRLTDAGELVSMRTDVTELHRAQQQAEDAAEAKSRFFASITHEVRTPLNGVIAMAELLLEGDMTEQQRSGVQLISQSGSSLLTIINDILDYSKIEAGKMTVLSEPFDVVEAVEDVVTLLSPEANRCGNEIGFQFDPALPRLISADHGRIRQIATNLIGNAIKFTNGGVIVVRLTGDLRDGDLHLVLEVEDSGVGIPADHLELIFSPFEQSGQAAKQNGTGLGLSICRQLATLMNGELSATSTPDVGSVFRFSAVFPVLEPGAAPETPFGPENCVALYGASPQAEALSAQLRVLGARLDGGGAPVLSVISLLNDGAVPAGLDYAPAAPAIIVAPIGAAPPTALIDRFPKGARLLRRPVRSAVLSSTISSLLAQSGGPRGDEARERRNARRITDAPRVLVAEDNSTNAAIIRAMLADQHLQVEVFPDAQGVIEAYERRKPALVVMDVYLPDMSGMEATKHIRAIEEMEQSNRTPIIAATASSLPEDRAACEQAGMDDFITKPLSKAQLQAKLSYWLGRSQTLAEAS